MSKVIFQKMGYELKSEQSLMNLAEFYCSKRETSRAWLGKYLQRKCREQNIEQSVYREWIESVLNACEESKMVNDKRYAEILIRELTRRGKGIRYIEQKLKQKGIPKDLREIPEDEEGEFLRALTLAKKISSGLKSKVNRKAQRKANQHQMNKYHRPTSQKFELKQKMLQKLISSGFSTTLSRKAIDQVLIELN